MRKLKTTALAAALTLGTTTAAHAAPTAFTLGNNGDTLVRFDPVTGAASGTDIRLAGGDGGLSIDGIAYRPNTGQLYAFSSDNDTFYTIDIGTGVATPVFTSGIDITTDIVGFDFNNGLDAARLVTVAGDNLVFDPDGNNDGSSSDPTVTRVTDLAYGDGYVGVTGPNLIGNAYINQLPQDQLPRNEAGDGPAIPTQFALDSQTDTLAILNNNAGTLDLVDTLTTDGVTALDFGSAGGFDIFSQVQEDGSITNIAYAILQTAEGNGIYRIDLGAAIATRLGTIPQGFGVLQGLVVFDVAPIPVPAAGALFAFGAAGLYGARRRKKAA